MKLFKNKYFILGNIALVLLAIPLTLLFISRQQDVRSRATPATRVYFEPSTVSFSGNSCGEQTVSIMVDPGTNIVSNVDLFLQFDETKFNVTIEPNLSTFPEVINGPNFATNQVSLELNTGGSVTNALQAPGEFGTLTISPIAATDSPAIVSVDTSKTAVFSLNQEADGDTENVFLSGDQVSVSVDSACIDGEPTTPTPTTFPGTLTPTPTGVGGAPTPTTTAPITPTPPQTANVAPACTTATVSPASSGAAPFVITLTAQGNDTDGTISQASFDFGDGITQEVTEGVGTAAVTTELSHTYATVGTYSATVTFTDNSGAVSTACTETIMVTAATSPTGGIAPTATPTPTPPIAATGATETTLIVIGGILLVVLGGLALIAL